MQIISMLLAVLASTIQIYTFVLLIRVLLSWFPNLDWSNPILGSVSSITDPYLNAFRGLIPPIGNIDLSAILAFITLKLIESSLIFATQQFLYIGTVGY